MSVVQVVGVTKGYGSKRLFENVNVSFTDGKRFGLTGPNGAGKSTFMKILSGDLEPDSGSVSRPEKTSVLKQDQYGFEDVRVLDVVIMGNAKLWRAMTEKDQILAKESLSDAEGMRLGELEGTIAEEDGYAAESDAATLLDGLGISSADQDRPMREIPGGLKLRVLLAQALFGKPDALLLDEPTNNLDIDTIRWLERFLVEFEGVVITISHDRHFLNAICTHVADIDYETIIVYTGGYDEMVMAKGQIRSRVDQENSERAKKIEQLQEFVAKFGAGTRASQVQSRKRQIEKLALSDLKRSNIARPFILLQQKKPSGKQTLTIEGLSKTWPADEAKPESRVVKGFDALIQKGEKIAIVGRNGAGKTTLCRMLVGELAPDAGKMEWGHQASVGYLAQDHREGIPNDTTVNEWLHGIDPSASLQDIRALLGKMLFTGDEGKKPTHALSGGEAVRLLFAKLMLTKDNVLVLDEPTNHLDLESIVALGDALSKYEGTAFVVAHDRDLIGQFATRVWAFTSRGLVDYRGDYEAFLAEEEAAPPAKTPSKAPPGKTKSGKG